jgi:hypothetical protein
MLTMHGGCRLGMISGIFHAEGVVGDVGEVCFVHCDKSESRSERNEKGYLCCDAARRPESARRGRTTTREGISVASQST